MLAGRVSAEIHVDADAVSHDLCAVLSQVTRDGRAVTLTQGYLRVADASAPGPRSVAMWAICATVPAGAALRLSLRRRHSRPSPSIPGPAPARPRCG